ncbi:hypothetical protein EDC04DRAFT_1248370 [Pisolithus marmoratus]|nr:hypothetical protein EDC04DRAFT_1248370 [Pisolithus marmoratus]
MLPHIYSSGDPLHNITGVLLCSITDHSVKTFKEALIFPSKSVSLDRVIRLKNYRILAQVTCIGAQIERGGHFITPVFSCTTYPRIITAHRWSVADVLAHMRVPTDMLRGRQMSTFHCDAVLCRMLLSHRREMVPRGYIWGRFAWRIRRLKSGDHSIETMQALIKGMFASRKTLLDPQNTYETGQLQ